MAVDYSWASIGEVAVLPFPQWQGGEMAADRGNLETLGEGSHANGGWKAKRKLTSSLLPVLHLKEFPDVHLDAARGKDVCYYYTRLSPGIGWIQKRRTTETQVLHQWRSYHR